MFKHFKILISLLSIVITASQALADSPDWASAQKPWVVDVSIGQYFDRMKQQTGILQVDSSETDPLIQTSHANLSNSFGASIGYKIVNLDQANWIQSLIFSFGIEQSTKSTLSGQRYLLVVLPDEYLGNYDLSGQSTKFVFAAQENFPSFYHQKITPYTLVGVGMNDDRIKYSDVVPPNDADAPSLTATKNTLNIFYRVGAGLAYSIDQAWQVNFNVTKDFQSSVTTTGYAANGAEVSDVAVALPEVQAHLGVSYQF